MQVRALDKNWDMTFGQGSANFFANSPQAVAQLVRTRLLLFTGEWFLDVTDGTPWVGKILGHNTARTRDQVIKSRILGTPGVTAIVPGSYSATQQDRALTVQCRITTQFGETQIAVTL